MGSRNLFKVLAQNFDVLAGSLVLGGKRFSGFRKAFGHSGLSPAIESKSHVDDQQWLTYWVLYSLITLFELTFAKVIEWFPIWPYAKLIATCWLVLPYFNGAAYVYEHYVRPCFKNAQTVNIWYIPRKKDIFSEPDDILTAAEKYIEENGPEAFEKLISKTNRGSKSRRNSDYMIFDDDDHYNSYDSNNFFHQRIHQSYT